MCAIRHLYQEGSSQTPTWITQRSKKPQMRSFKVLRRRTAAMQAVDDKKEPGPSPPAPPGSDPGPGDKLGRLSGEDKDLQLPKEVIERLKYTVFGFDTMWVTSVENYESDGVAFKGNLRGQSVKESFKKMQQRMKVELGDEYRLFLLNDKEDKPTALVLRREYAREGSLNKVTEVWLAVTFAVLTGITTLNANGVPLVQFLVDPFRTLITSEDLVGALPGAVAFWFLLGSHEWGHWWAAQRRGVGLYLPFIIPAGFGSLGSFGGITRFRGFLPDREALLDIATKGPAVGAVTSLVMVMVGFLLTAAGVRDVGIESATFADSLFMALTAQLFLGEQLTQPLVEVNTLVVAGWAGLIVNALNCIPAGEIDGGRIALGLWGRRGAAFCSVWSIAAMTGASFNNALSFYWLILILLLQRGPILPCEDEISEPQDSKDRWMGIALLLLPLLVLLPFPVELAVAIQNLQDPVLF